jgi:uncharacterized protein (TIGR03083 family)
MTDAYNLREMVADEQREFAELLRGLTPEEWASPSLCAGWPVHDVVIHIAKHVHTTARERNTQLARLKFSEDRQLDLDRGRTTDELIEWLASPAVLFGPTNILTQLSELVVHQQDVRRPLGLPRTIPSERLSVVLDFGLTVTGSLSVALARRRAKGLRLSASDMPWAAGTGPEVRGPGEAIFMALNGRPAAGADLAGDGVARLAARLS